MTKAEAFRSVYTLSAGTIAGVVGSSTYMVIDSTWGKWLESIEKLQDDAFQSCEHWGRCAETHQRQSVALCAKELTEVNEWSTICRKEVLR